ncbi:MAG TPA: hypothetical protein VMF66_04025 [Candidatus Acidoferrum sp.]|nr:hypothetical protein [Candidatus Acidoferrum sp.]
MSDDLPAALSEVSTSAYYRALNGVLAGACAPLTLVLFIFIEKYRVPIC